MVKPIILCIFSGLFCLFLLFTLSGPAQAGESAFTGRTAYEHTEYLAKEIGPRPPGSKQEILAGDYIAETLRNYGWQVTVQEFSRVTSQDSGSLKKYSLINSRNIIAVRPGKSLAGIVIGAHYDSADFNTPGAGDNASGVGVLLELGRVLGQQTTDQEIILVAFGAEEAGLVGSRYFTDHYDLSRIKLMINLDMVGEGDKVALDGGGKVSTLPALLKGAYREAKDLGLKPQVRRDFMLIARDSKEGGTSDFSPFLDKWIPAIGLGQGGRPPSHYHQPSDTMDHVNPKTLQAYGRLVLSLMGSASSFQASGQWEDIYFTLDLGVILLVFGLPVIKLVGISGLLLALFWLVIKRSQRWFSLVWVLPGLWLLTGLIILASFLPVKLIGLFKRLDEPWFAHPGFFLVLQLSVSVVLFYWLIGFIPRLPRKTLPPERDIYWAGSLILLAGGTVLIASRRWDFALYISIWLLFVTLSYFRRGPLLAVFGPILIYAFHWQLLNSHFKSELYRTVYDHPVIFSGIYGFGLLPLVLSLLSCVIERYRSWPRLSLKVASSVVLVLTFSVFFVPAYTKADPQQITLRQEWQEHKLTLKASSKDLVPLSLVRIVGAKESAKEISVPLQGAAEPLDLKLGVQEVKLARERLLTAKIDLDYRKSPSLLKIKLRSEKPFSLVNAGDFFPPGSLAKNIKLNGEPTGGIYGLVLERTPPQPASILLYIKAEGQVRLTFEAQYPAQFVSKTFSVPNSVLKYENYSIVVKEL